MRWILSGLAIASLALAAPCEARVSQAVEAGEITVQTAATGISIFPADKATTTVIFTKPGADNKAARANVRALAEEFIRGLTDLGIPRTDIDLQEPTIRMASAGNEDNSEGVRTVGDAIALLNRPKTATASLVITIFDLKLLPALNRYIDERNAPVIGTPGYSLSDGRRARDAAIADGVSKARADADAYAAALGMRVSRVISAGDQAAQSIFSFPDYEKMIEGMTGRSEVKHGMVKTSVQVVAKFGLAGR